MPAKGQVSARRFERLRAHHIEVQRENSYLRALVDVQRSEIEMLTQQVETERATMHAEIKETERHCLSEMTAMLQARADAAAWRSGSEPEFGEYEW